MKDAKDRQPLPLDLEVRLVSSLVMVGEPIVLHYRLANTSEQLIAVHMGRDQKDWLTLRLGGPSETAAEPSTVGTSRVEGQAIHAHIAKVSANHGWAVPNRTIIMIA